MAKQLHKRFSTEEVKMLLRKYLDEKVELTYILEILNIKRSRFFELLKGYRKDPDGFSIEYDRKKPTREIPDEVEKNVTSELEIAKSLIEENIFLPCRMFFLPMVFLFVIMLTLTLSSALSREEIVCGGVIIFKQMM